MRTSCACHHSCVKLKRLASGCAVPVRLDRFNQSCDGPSPPDSQILEPHAAHHHRVLHVAAVEPVPVTLSWRMPHWNPRPRPRLTPHWTRLPFVLERRYRLKYAHHQMRMEINMASVHTSAAPRGPRIRNSGKRATNLSLSADVLDAAKRLQINVSQVCDTHLREVVRREQESRWREEHADFVAAYNAIVETEGLPLDGWRSF